MASEAWCRLLLACTLVCLWDQARCLNADGFALLEFRNLVEDPGGFFSSWNAGSPNACNWSGITCEHGQVVKILIRNANLSGTISPALSRIPYLRTIVLSQNRLSGHIPSEIATMPNLRKLNLSRNAFTGGFPPPLGKLPSLRMLDLSVNYFAGFLPGDLFQNCVKFRYISLAGNIFLGRIPPSLGSCTALTGIDLSSNLFIGSIPPSLGQLQMLQYLSLQQNLLTGAIPAQLGSCISLQSIDLSDNHLTGHVPKELGLLGKLEVLSVNKNSLSGPFPPEVLYLPVLRSLNASGNSFEGDVPGSLLSPEQGRCQKLELLDLSSNVLAGGIPADVFSCQGLKLLNLSHNRVASSIPDAVGELSALHTLDLSFNNMSGPIPAGISNLQNLIWLDLRSNPLGGRIPDGIGQVKLLMYLNFDRTLLEGEVPEALGGLEFLLDLKLSNNRLNGTIPKSLGRMKYLRSLELEHNMLLGSIPYQLSFATNLEQLDLSYNNLSGCIPMQLGGLTKLLHFNVSYNNLTGLIPRNGIMQQYDQSSYIGNTHLCGQPLTLRCTPLSWPGPALPPMFGKGKARVLSVSAIIAIAAAAAVALGVAVITILNMKAMKRPRRTELLVYESSEPSPATPTSSAVGKFVLFSTRIDSKYDNWQEGTKALVDKECLVGYGPLGTVHRTVIDGVPLAVKKLSSLGNIKTQEEFEDEVAVLGNVKHRNLAAFEGYFWSQGTQLLLSEFLPNDSLFHHLHDRLEGQPPLPWWRRFKIAQGTARALAYLHHDRRPRILLGNLKSTNILLDDDFEPHVTDYGLSKLLPKPEDYFADPKLEQAGAGYTAPEMAVQAAVLSEKSDVYSFGVILLELVSGRRPVESNVDTDVVVLSEYARQLYLQGRALVLVDPDLGGSFPEREIMQVLRLGLVCASQEPAKRPAMSEVVQMLELYVS